MGRNGRAEVPALLLGDDKRGPDFICIGAQKGGTRWLFDQLNNHPDFRLPPMKEVRALDHAERFKKQAKALHRQARTDLPALNRKLAERRERLFDERDVAWLEARLWMQGKPLDLEHYASLFSQRDGLLTGDISPRYALIPDETAAAVRARFPGAKILYLARDPVSRFWSHYCMMVRRRETSNPADMAGVVDFAERGSGIRHSRILPVVERWRLGGDDSNFRLFFFDDLKTDADGLLNRILEFLDAPNPKKVDTLEAGFNRKSSQAKVPMTDEVRAYLVDLFADEINNCAKSLGGAAESWPSRYGV